VYVLGGSRFRAASRAPLLAALLLACLILVLGSSASAATIYLSSVSSDETPAGVLDATFELSVLGGDTLELVVTNDTTAPNAFNINEVFFGSSASVTSLTLLTATHSDAGAGIGGDVTAEWLPVYSSVMADGFGTFDHGLIGTVGETAPEVIGPGESITFLLDITGACAGSYTCTAADFVAPNGSGYTAAAKFVNGPGDDSAFGAVPEPSTALMVGLGLAAVAAGRSPRR